MAGVRRFEDLICWQLCMDLSDHVFRITSDGPASENLEYQDQIREAAASAPALIAEGFLRFTTAEIVRYTRMARGELGEVQTRLETGRRRGYFPADELETTRVLVRRAMGTTTNFLKSKVRQLARERRAAKRR
jgi:four helix bundle protein